jgi:hypothetical protein
MSHFLQNQMKNGTSTSAALISVKAHHGSAKMTSEKLTPDPK